MQIIRQLIYNIKEGIIEKNSIYNLNIYYFLGNITSHVIHALPLYNKIGGIFVVTSKKAKLELLSYNVRVELIDDIPYVWQRNRLSLNRQHEYINLPQNLAKTFNFLDTNADVVIFYELFHIPVTLRLSHTPSIFLTHGNMLKSYMTMNPQRLESIKYYTKMAALGPYMHKIFIEDGVAENQLLKLGISRTDEIIAKRSTSQSKGKIANILGVRIQESIISYLPTFWGASSIYDTGFDIVDSFPNNRILLFRPHPQTPKKIIRKYLKRISNKPNIIYISELDNNDISLVDVLCASDAIIGDVSSVVLEAIVAEVPLIFAYGSEKYKQEQSSYKPIESIVAYSGSIKRGECSNLSQTIDNTIKKGIDKELWKQVQKHTFYDIDGNATDSIVNQITKLAEWKRTD